MTNGILVALFNLLGGVVVDCFKRAPGWKSGALQRCAFFAYAVLMYDLSLLARMREDPYEQSGQKLNLFNLLIRPFKERNTCAPWASPSLWSMMANIPGSYYSVYLLAQRGGELFLHQHCQHAQRAGAGASHAALVAVPAPPLSWLKTCNVSIALYALNHLLLGLVNKGNYLWLYPTAQIYAFVLATGINLSFTNIPISTFPARTRPSTSGSTPRCAIWARCWASRSAASSSP